MVAVCSNGDGPISPKVAYVASLPMGSFLWRKNFYRERTHKGGLNSRGKYWKYFFIGNRETLPP
jgi:hypothetical protein